MVLKSTWASGEVLTAVDFNAVATDVNTASTTLATVATAATANSIAKRDASGNLIADNFHVAFATTPTAAGTTTLTIDSTGIQEFTGTQTHTVVLPTTSVPAGAQYRILNNSTAALTVQSSSLAQFHILAPGTEAVIIALIATPTLPAHWEDSLFGTSFAAGKSLTVNNSLTLAGTDGTTMTFPATSGTVVTSGSAISGTTLTSTVATGTAPLTVASTTVVPNLNASLLVGQTSTSAATANTVVNRDVNINASARNFINGFTTSATAAGTTTLTIASNPIQEFTGTQAQTVVLPTTGIVAGQQLKIINNSTGLITVQSSALATLTLLIAGTEVAYTALVATPTAAADWEEHYYVGPASVMTLTNKRINPRVGSTASTATPSINTDLYDQYNITGLATAITGVTVSGTAVDGQKLTVRIVTSTSNRAVTWGASFQSSGLATLPTIAYASKTHTVGFIYDLAAAIWVCMASDVVGY